MMNRLLILVGFTLQFSMLFAQNDCNKNLFTEEEASSSVNRFLLQSFCANNIENCNVNPTNINSLFIILFFLVVCYYLFIIPLKWSKASLVSGVFGIISHSGAAEFNLNTRPILACKYGSFVNLACPWRLIAIILFNQRLAPKPALNVGLVFFLYDGLKAVWSLYVTPTPNVEYGSNHFVSPIKLLKSYLKLISPHKKPWGLRDVEEKANCALHPLMLKFLSAVNDAG